MRYLALISIATPFDGSLVTFCIAAASKLVIPPGDDFNERRITKMSIGCSQYCHDLLDIISANSCSYRYGLRSPSTARSAGPACRGRSGIGKRNRTWRLAPARTYRPRGPRPASL
jgi:hypothetical protein